MRKAIDHVIFIINALVMYIKSEEELSGVLQTLPEIFKERYHSDIDWTSVLLHLKTELEKQKNQTIERQFSGWSVPSLLAMINTLERKLNPPEPKKRAKK